MSRLAPVLLLLLPLLAASCSSLPTRPDYGRSQEERAERISREISKIREIEIKQPVPVASMTTAQLKDLLQEELDKDWEEEGAGLERAYKVFGLLPAGIDLKPWLRDFMKDQIAGFYHVEKKAFYTVDPGAGDDQEEAQPPEMQTFILSHELTHALEDQHFDFEAARERMKKMEDTQAAYESLLEGSAVEAGVEHMLWRQGVPLSTAGCIGRVLANFVGEIESGDIADLNEAEKKEVDAFLEAPPFVQARLLFPYLKGWRLVNQLRSEFGWRGVDEAYARPPESTEQVLHPERYIDRLDRPVVVELPPAPEGLKELHQGTLGMLGVQQLFELHLGAKAGRHAEGWDGDRYVLWDSASGDALGWVSVWDSNRKARRFVGAYTRLLSGQGGKANAWAIEWQGNVVAVTQGALGMDATRFAKGLLASKITVAPDDQGPTPAMVSALLWPLSVRPLDRVWEASLLGGLVLDSRWHGDGHRLRVADSLLLHTESSPDRVAAWMLLGLIGGTRDRTLDFSYARIPFLLKWHRRGNIDGESNRTRCGMALSTVLYDRHGEKRRFKLLWGILLSSKWGDEAGARARVLGVPVLW